MWTVALTLTGLSGIWLVARHWYGWILYLINEVLWLAYGLSIRSTPVIVMAVLWFATGARNLVVQRALQTSPDLPAVQPELRDDGGDGPALADNVRALREYRDGIQADIERAFWRPY